MESTSSTLTAGSQLSQSNNSPLFRDLVVGFNFVISWVSEKNPTNGLLFQKISKKTLDAFIVLMSGCQLMNIKISWFKITICGKKVNKHVKMPF